MNTLLRSYAPLRYRCVKNSYYRSFAVHAFKLPDIGEGIAEVQVMEWFVKEGDHVKEMDRLFVVESDKASVEITSRYDGTVKSIHAAVNSQAKVGSVIVEIDDGETSTVVAETPSPAPSSKSAETPRAVPSQKVVAPVSSPPANVQALPSVRNLAKQRNIDLSEVVGTGKDGRITESDVLAFGTRTGDSSVVKLGQVGLAMVKSMNESLSVPQFTHSDEIDCENVLASIKVLKPEFGGQLTLTAFFVKALSVGIHAFPLVNSRLSADQTSYQLFSHHNISIAMDSPRGLVVPNIKNVESLSIVEIQQKLASLQERAKTGRLTLEDVKGGTLAFSNIGVIGGTYTKPILFDGQAVIGAVGRAVTVPRYTKTFVLEPRRILNISWTADHRYIDGATIARFSNICKDLIENPEKLIAKHFSRS